MNLDGLCLHVSATAAQGVVGEHTRLRLMQKGERVFGRYDGGRIARGYLVGGISGARLVFRYYRWDTREGDGTNVFDET